MTTPSPPPPTPDLLPARVAGSWREFLERFESLRPELYRYCRHLTRSPWEADDLVQDALMRSFVTLGFLHEPVRNPRAWLFKVASNLWLHRVRDAHDVATDPASMAAMVGVIDADDSLGARDAAGALFTRLSPQQRAAIVLVEVFELTLAEAADALSTTIGSVKSALHRGRATLAQPLATEPRDVPVPAVLHAFCDAFNARDLERLASLLLDDAVVEAPGLAIEYGREAARRGSLAGALFGDPTRGEVGIAPVYRTGMLPQAPTLELRVHRGEVLLLGWFAHADGRAVRAISRVSLADDHVSHLRTVMHAPDVLAEVCAELDVPFRSSGYRYWWSA